VFSPPPLPQAQLQLFSPPQLLPPQPQLQHQLFERTTSQPQRSGMGALKRVPPPSWVQAVAVRPAAAAAVAAAVLTKATVAATRRMMRLSSEPPLSRAEKGRRGLWRDQ